MTSPIEDVIVICPKCGNLYKDWYRPSVNLMLDDFDDDYLDECISSKCPDCGHKVYFKTLTVDKDGVFKIQS